MPWYMNESCDGNELKRTLPTRPYRSMFLGVHAPIGVLCRAAIGRVFRSFGSEKRTQHFLPGPAFLAALVGGSLAKNHRRYPRASFFYD
jgi:hypothetical protein